MCVCVYCLCISGVGVSQPTWRIWAEDPRSNQHSLKATYAQVTHTHSYIPTSAQVTHTHSYIPTSAQVTNTSLLYLQVRLTAVNQRP